jgi:hypothetical protein
MRQLMALTFREEIYVDWRKQRADRKQYILDTLRSEFPCPDGYTFSDRFMLHRMSQWMNHRRSEVRDAIREGKKRLSGCAKSDWDHMKREIENNPEKFKQQREAAKKRQDSLGASHLGSGGKGHFMAYFVSIHNSFLHLSVMQLFLYFYLINYHLKYIIDFVCLLYSVRL